MTNNMKILIGGNGVIGNTLRDSIRFGSVLNSNDIQNIEYLAEDGDELYLSCLPAAKWKVNQNVVDDFNNVQRIIKYISKVKYSKVVLISTIDVYNGSPFGVDENYNPNVGKLSYGTNRYLFELLVREYVKTTNLKIFRLPAIYGTHFKKNVLFDLINNNNVKDINANSAYQWYNLEDLDYHINLYSEKYLTDAVFNLFPEPVETEDIVKLFPEHEGKICFSTRTEYDYRTKYGKYIENSSQSFKRIMDFVSESRRK
jgi:nucleoside-diphosphate-sugar epimerase